MVLGRLLTAARVIAIPLVLALGTAPSSSQASDGLEPVAAEVPSFGTADRLVNGAGYGLLGSLAGGLAGGGLGCGIGAVSQIGQTGYFSGPLFGCLAGGLLLGVPSFLLGMPIGISLFGAREPVLHPGLAYWGTFLGAGAGIGAGALIYVLSNYQGPVMWTIPSLAFVGAVLGWALPARLAPDAAAGNLAWAPTFALAADGKSGSLGIAGHF